ncbi:MAG: DUF11 domain-containing protein [Gallionella sp.]|nr:DUF11 domain-containing protein [Gallionella sp.]
MWVVLFLVLPQMAWAGGTPSGQVIANRVSVGYVIGNIADSRSSNTILFAVDKKINLLVTETTGAPTLVVAGQPAAVTTFHITNLGNDPQGYSLSATQANGNPSINGVAPFDTNNFNGAGWVAYVDANNDGIYEPLIDTATSISSLNPDATKTVFIVSDIPSSVTSGQQSVVRLTATTTAVGGAALTASSSADTLLIVDTVFADAAGPVDIAHDAKHSAYAAYLINDLTVTLSKTIVSVQPASGPVVLNPASGDTVLRPGSIITYQIVASFAGTGTVNNLVITDPIPANTTYVPQSITVNGIAQTDAADTPTDNTEFIGNTITITRGTVTVPATNVVIQFQATIN